MTVRSVILSRTTGAVRKTAQRFFIEKFPSHHSQDEEQQQEAPSGLVKSAFATVFHKNEEDPGGGNGNGSSGGGGGGIVNSGARESVVRFDLSHIQYHEDTLRNMNSCEEWNQCWYDPTSLKEFKAEQMAMTQNIFEDHYRLPPEQAKAAEEWKGTLTNAFKACIETTRITTTTTSTTIATTTIATRTSTTTATETTRTTTAETTTTTETITTTTIPNVVEDHGSSCDPKPELNTTKIQQHAQEQKQAESLSFPTPLDSISDGCDDADPRGNLSLVDNLEQLYRRASDVLVGLETNILARLRGKDSRQNRSILRRIEIVKGKEANHKKDHNNSPFLNKRTSTATTTTEDALASSSTIGSDEFESQQRQHHHHHLEEDDLDLALSREIASITEPSVRFAHAVALAQAKAIVAMDKECGRNGSILIHI